MPMKLKRSNDRKVTTYSGVNNAFGLPSGKAFSCPGATSVCERICYAGFFERMYSGVRNLLENNWQILTNSSHDEMVGHLTEMIAEFRAETLRYQSKGKNAELKFRIHWDGDFFSADYAMAWAEVIRAFPDVSFWAYTRSFEFAPILKGIDNLSLYLSVDKDNLPAARKVPGVRWAYLDETMAEAKTVMLAERGIPGAACPENTKQIPLIVDKVGACISCNLCPESKADIRFAIKGR